MRVLIVLALTVLVMSWIGWLTYNSGSDRSAVVLEQAKIQEDTSQALEATKEFAEEAVESTREAINQLGGSDDRSEPVQAEPEPVETIPAPGTGP